MEETSGRPRLQTRERLPDLRLADASGRALPLMPPGGRQVPVVVVMDRAECEACGAFLRRLAEAEPEMRAWDGRVVAVVPGGGDEAARVAESIHAPFPVLADPERKLARRMGISGAAVVVADPWGEVRYRHDTGAAHDLPDGAELVDWVRFVAIQCPECEGEAL